MPGILHDITRPIDGSLPVWPGDTPYRLDWGTRLADGGSTNTGALCSTTHCGTHVDAPLHLFEGGTPAGRLPLDVFIGPAWLVDVGGAVAIDAEMVSRLVPEGTERVLFRTGCWRDGSRFPVEFPAPTVAAARELVSRGVRLVGTDAPSVDPFESTELPTHRALFAGGASVVENLVLDGLPPGEYRLIAFPLRLDEADASPVRAVLLPSGG